MSNTKRYMIKEGVFDSVLITKAVKYTTASPPAPPTAPLIGGAYPTADGYEFTTTINPNKGPPEVLLHFDNNYTNDGSGGDAVPTIVTANGNVVVTETSEMAGTFGNHLNITNSITGGGNYVTVPDPGWETGAFTIEAFINPVSVSGSNQAWFGVNDSINGASGWVIGTAPYTGYTSLALYLRAGSSGTTTLYFDPATHEGVIVGTMAHYAIVREAENGSGTATYRAYRNGIYMGSASPSAANTRDFTGEDLLIGRTDGSSSGNTYACTDINIDEFRFSHGEVYKGTDTSAVNFVVPIAPFGPLVGSGTGYEVGGASDTSFEGSIDELRIVKDDSEAPPVGGETDEYDCS
jgi:hypothetical protein